MSSGSQSEFRYALTSDDMPHIRVLNVTCQDEEGELGEVEDGEEEEDSCNRLRPDVCGSV